MDLSFLSDLPNIVYIVLAVGIGWIVLRFVLKIAARIFKFGCLAIAAIGWILIALKYVNG